MTKIPLIALFPVACPHCARGYQLELDVVKLARLKRVAVCGQCGERFSVSVRIKRSAAAPFALPTEASPYGRNGADDIPDAAAVLASLKTDPDIQRPVFRGDPWERQNYGALEAPEPRISDIERVATLPDQRVDMGARKSADEDEPAPGRRQQPRRTASSPQRTLEGIGAVPAKDKANIDTHIILEVGPVGDGPDNAKKRKRSFFRPDRLVTKPGLGIPFALRAAGTDDVTNAIEDPVG